MRRAKHILFLALQASLSLGTLPQLKEAASNEMGDTG